MITDTSDNMLVEYNQDAIGFSPIFPDDLFEEFQNKLSAMYRDSGLMFQVMCSFKEYEEVEETA